MLNIENLFLEIQQEMLSPKKHYLEGKELLPEPDYGNEKANAQIEKNLKLMEKYNIMEKKVRENDPEEGTIETKLLTKRNGRRRNK